jgi:hypothetical protein
VSVNPFSARRISIVRDLKREGAPYCPFNVYGIELVVKLTLLLIPLLAIQKLPKMRRNKER